MLSIGDRHTGIHTNRYKLIGQRKQRSKSGQRKRRFYSVFAFELLTSSQNVTKEFLNRGTRKNAFFLEVVASNTTMLPCTLLTTGPKVQNLYLILKEMQSGSRT